MSNIVDFLSANFSTILSSLTLVLVAIIESISLTERNKEKKANEKRDLLANQRAEENRLAMRMEFATLQLSIVCANALTGGHNNGNVERAKAAAEEAEASYRSFIQSIAVRQINE